MAFSSGERLIRVPRYQQVNDLLRETLRAGEFAEGEGLDLRGAKKRRM